MKIGAKHIPFDQLVDLAEKRTTGDGQTAALSHLSDCSVCKQQMDRLGQVMALMRTDTAADAPRDVLADTVGLIRQGKAFSEPSLLKRLVAALTFDSSSNLAPAFGLRSGQATSRQLLYSAEETDIDLRIAPQNDDWIVAGQVLGQDCVGGRIEIEGKHQSTAAELNDLCEFTLPPLPAGSYTIRLRLRNAEIEIPQVDLRA